MSNVKKKKEKRKRPHKFVCGASFVQLTSVRLAVAVSLSGGLTVEACEAPWACANISISSLLTATVIPAWG